MTGSGQQTLLKGLVLDLDNRGSGKLYTCGKAKIYSVHATCMRPHVLLFAPRYCIQCLLKSEMHGNATQAGLVKQKKSS